MHASKLRAFGVQNVPVLVIAHDTTELDGIHKKLEERMIKQEKIMANADLQKLCQFDDKGKLLRDEWGKIMCALGESPIHTHGKLTSSRSVAFCVCTWTEPTRRGGAEERARIRTSLSG